MPSNKVLEQKKAIVAEIAEKLKSSCAGVVVSYQGINVEDDTKLRKSLRESQIEYLVIKNTLLKKAVEKAGMNDISSVLHGSTALAMSKNDYISASKILCEFASNHEFFKVKSGFIDGRIIDSAEVTRLSKLPSREVLISQVLRGLNAPIQGFANVLNGTLKGLVIALNAIAEKKKEESN